MEKIAILNTIISAVLEDYIKINITPYNENLMMFEETQPISKKFCEVT